MNAPLHGSNRDAFDIADYEIPRMAYSGAAREGWNFRVGDTGGVAQFVSKSAQARAQNQSDAGAKASTRQNGLRCMVGVGEFVEISQNWLLAFCP